MKCVTGAICDPSNIRNMLVCVNTGDRRDKSRRGYVRKRCRGLHVDKAVRWIFQMVIQQEYNMFTYFNCPNILVVQSDNEDDDALQSKYITYCKNANSNLLNPENTHTQKLCVHIAAEIPSLFWEQRCWDLGVLLWRRRYSPWWWTGHLCNLNVIHWKHLPHSQWLSSECASKRFNYFFSLSLSFTLWSSPFFPCTSCLSAVIIVIMKQPCL